MARSIWKGSINFGLVNIPVSLYSAEQRADIQLHMIDSRDHSRIRYERVNGDTGKEVPWEEIVRGYEYDEGKYVLLSDEEMEKVKTEVTKTVEIERFVDLDEIDPIYFDKPYFLVPDKKQRAARKVYALLRETLRRTNKVGIAQVVIRSREYLCAVMVRGEMLLLNLLRFAQELRDPSEYDLPGGNLKELKISTKEIDMATQLVETMTDEWKPEDFHDSYRAALMEWIEKKIEEGEFEEVDPPDESDDSEPAKGKVVDLMDYLKKSVEDAKGSGKSTSSKSSPKKKTSSRRGAAKTSPRKKTSSRKRKAA